MYGDGLGNFVTPISAGPFALNARTMRSRSMVHHVHITYACTCWRYLNIDDIFPDKFLSARPRKYHRSQKRARAKPTKTASFARRRYVTGTCAASFNSHTSNGTHKLFSFTFVSRLTSPGSRRRARTAIDQSSRDRRGRGGHPRDGGGRREAANFPRARFSIRTRNNRGPSTNDIQETIKSDIDRKSESQDRPESESRAGVRSSHNEIISRQYAYFWCKSMDNLCDNLMGTESNQNLERK
ncbi:hypothetical protein EVAR_97971_1 [Eumeta japonica]|uniref:Uncharacterized protein n=1 Tax=Eumeta variegata TaxID=151549 RepID=A0A4C1XFX9_EUMVA|nr:hypothetical protein EVAR_97971_1 [Eumeta japonica]